MITTLNKSLFSRCAALAVFFLFTMTSVIPAQNARAQQVEDEDIDQVVARISYIQGSVSYSRGDDPDNWDPALINLPFTMGDSIYSSPDGRAELDLPGGNFIHTGRGTYINALTLTYDTKQFYLGNGAATINVRRLDRDEIFEIDTPNVAVTLEEPGRYRIEVDENGDTRVIARRGVALVAANGRQVPVERAEMRIYGQDAGDYEFFGLRAVDAFDRWVDERNARYESRYRAAYQYADEEIVGLEELADHGRWEEIPEYGYAWTPTRVVVGWQPFTVGHWFWQDPWGWTWISAEPWGWAPCHYGRWTFYQSRWYWVPVRRRAAVVRYAPAVVEFVYVGGHVGWFPLHPRDRFVPWWGRRARVVEEVTYVNRTRIVIVNEQTFISARRINANLVRDTAIVREATTIRIRERSLPVPRRESLRVTVDRQARVQRPPANIISRPVVVRTAPTPPPPRFDEKLRLIRERKGQPLRTEEIVNLGAKDFKSKRRMEIRPAVESGRGGFAPRTKGGAAPASQPLTAAKGRKLATKDEPVLTDLPRREQRAPQRQEKQVQEQQQRKDQEQERKQQEQDRLQKQQERERQKDQKQIEKEQRKDQEQDRREQERKQQEQQRLQKQQEQDRQKQLKQLDEQKSRDLNRQKQEQERDRQRQLQDQQRKEQQLRQQQQREELKDREQERLQDQERQKQLQEQQQQQRKTLQEQKREDLERRRQELERQRLEKQQQPQRREEDQQSRDLERQRQQEIQQEPPPRKQVLEEQRKQPQRKQPPPAPPEKTEGRVIQEPPPGGAPPPPPPR